MNFRRLNVLSHRLLVMSQPVGALNIHWFHEQVVVRGAAREQRSR
eukprot:SAG11_NODE_12323_length_709_cov_0.850820_2_plen_44_part_01